MATDPDWSQVPRDWPSLRTVHTAMDTHQTNNSQARDSRLVIDLTATGHDLDHNAAVQLSIQEGVQMEVQAAIAADATARHPETQQSTPIAASESLRSTPGVDSLNPPKDLYRRKSQLETTESMTLRLANEFDPIVQANWDTLIWIGPPPRQHGQDGEDYQYVTKHFSTPYLLNSNTLRETKSTEFARLLGPASARAQRRLKKLGLHLNLPGGKQPTYYIDLRPPQDDEEAVLLITELECTPNVLSWKRDAMSYGVDRAYIHGTDGLNSSYNMMRSLFVDRLAEDEPTYSALRHRSAIERLLHTICEGDPRLDSAPKAWSFLAIAKYFDCAELPSVVHKIHHWLFADFYATNFVQMNTETAYRMAIGMKSAELARITFAMLVGKAAFARSGEQLYPPNATPSVTGARKLLSSLDDDEINRIDHAAQAFAHRMQALFDKLHDHPNTWMLRSPEAMKLFTLQAQDQSQKQFLVDTWHKLCQHVQGKLKEALLQEVDAAALSQSATANKAHGQRAFHDDGGIRISSAVTVNTYNAAPSSQRLLSQVFWRHLRSRSFHDGCSETIKDRFDESDDESSVDDTGKNTLNRSLNAINDMIAYGDVKCLRKIDVNGIYTIQEDLRQEGIYQETLRRENVHFHHSDPSDPSEKAWEEALTSARQNIPPVNPDAAVRNTNHETRSLAAENLALRREMQLLSLDASNETRSYKTTPMNMLDATSEQEQTEWDGSFNEYYCMRINKFDLFTELDEQLRKFIDEEVLTSGWIKGSDISISEIPTFEIHTLLCLDDEEWKFMPLWADGNDDGTGGVFVEQHVPDVAPEEGFQGGKRGLGDDEGLADLPDVEMGEAGYSVVDGSDFEEITRDDGVSTIGLASKVATDGSTTVIGAGSVISMEE